MKSGIERLAVAPKNHMSVAAQYSAPSHELRESGLLSIGALIGSLFWT